VAREAVNEVVLAAVRLIGDHHDITPLGERRVAVAFLFREELIASSRDIFGCSKNRQNRIVENSTYPLDDFGFR